MKIMRTVGSLKVLRLKMSQRQQAKPLKVSAGYKIPRVPQNREKKTLLTPLTYQTHQKVQETMQ